MEEKDIIELLGKVSFKDETFSGQTEVWENIKHSIDSRKTKTIWMHRSWIIAASVAVILCITCWFSMKTTVISSDHSMAVSLPDGSEVELAAGASVSYSRLKWLFARTIRLHGNAGFDVTKGKRFTVKTDCGSDYRFGNEIPNHAGRGHLIARRMLRRFRTGRDQSGKRDTDARRTSRL